VDGGVGHPARHEDRHAERADFADLPGVDLVVLHSREPGS
jgi:hypothetical protein